MKADGIILITNGEHTGKMLSESDLPVIVVDRHLADCGEIAFIESDHYKGGRLAAQCLYDRGCRKIVCLRGPQEYASGVLRFKGYSDVCREHGLELRYVDTAYDFEAGRRAAEEMLDKFPDADGVFAANDIVAISAYKVFRKRGIRVPDDIQIIGFDDINLSSLVTPELTTIRQPIREMGYMAVDVLCSYAEGKPFPRECKFDVELIERETTGNKLSILL